VLRDAGLVAHVGSTVDSAHISARLQAPLPQVEVHAFQIRAGRAQTDQRVHRLTIREAKLPAKARVAHVAFVRCLHADAHTPSLLERNGQEGSQLVRRVEMHTESRERLSMEPCLFSDAVDKDLINTGADTADDAKFSLADDLHSASRAKPSLGEHVQGVRLE